MGIFGKVGVVVVVLYFSSDSANLLSTIVNLI